MLSEDERSLLIVAVGFLAAVTIWVLVLNTRVRVLFANLRSRDPELWAELGSPETVRDTLRDPERRWRRFIASGEYRRRLGAGGIDEIDDFRRRSTFMLVVFGAAALLILVRYWPLLKPSFL